MTYNLKCRGSLEFVSKVSNDTFGERVRTLKNIVQIRLPEKTI